MLHPAANAMVADLVPREKRIKAYALLRIAQNLGWAIGPMLGGFIAQRSYGAMFLAGGTLFRYFLFNLPA